MTQGMCKKIRAKILHSEHGLVSTTNDYQIPIHIEAEPQTAKNSGRKNKKVVDFAKPLNHFEKAKSKKDEDHEGKFSNYISNVKKRMMRTASSVGDIGRTTARRDSFNDKVTSYINHAKVKIRATPSTVGDQKKVSFE